MLWNPTDLAYLAGLIDGEGTICIFIHNDRMRLILTVYNSHAECLQWVQTTFGGRFRQVKRRRRDWKPSYVWETGWQHAAGILRAVLPYLRIKKLQAELFLACAATCSRQANRGGVAPELTRLRQDFAKRVQELNRTGADNALDSP